MQSNPFGDLFKQFQQMQGQGGNGDGAGNPLSGLMDRQATGSAGDGAVTATVNALGEVKDLKIDSAVVDKDDVETLQDLIITAINDARKKLQDEAMSGLGNMGNFGNIGNMLNGLFGNIFSGMNGMFNQNNGANNSTSGDTGNSSTATDNENNGETKES